MRAQKGFTLVELVVVIAILGVLAAITVPRVNQFLQQATEQSYHADVAIVQSAVSAWYSDLHNEQFLGTRQFPIIERDETGQEGRIIRGEEGVDGVDAVGPFDHKDDGFPLAPSDAAGPDWNPLGGSQGVDLLHVGEDGVTAWQDDGNGIRGPGTDTWTTVEINYRGHTYWVDPRYYFLDMQALVDSGWLQSVPASSSKDNSPAGTGSYTYYIDHRGKVETLFFHFPMIQGFVQDNLGAGEQFPTPVSPNNTRPTASITSPANGSTFPSTGSVTFTGTGSDAEDGVLSGNSLVWTSSINGQIGIGAPLDASLSVGNHTITLRAKDSSGVSGTDSINISVIISTPFNSRPVASIDAPANNLTFITTDSITFTGSAFDAQDGQLSGDSLVWTSNIIGQIGSGNTFDASLAAGSHLVTLIATDSLGGLGSASVNVTVNEAPSNNAPTASINIPDDVFNYLTTDSIAFTGTGSDAEDGSLSGSALVWTSNLDGLIGSGASINASLSEGSHVISLTVTDSSGATGTESINVTVNTSNQNVSPTASINTPDDDFDYLTSETINFTGTGSDPEDGNLTGSSLVWSSSLTGRIGTGTSIGVSLGAGSHTVTLIATDSQGGAGSASITVTVTGPGSTPTPTPTPTPPAPTPTPSPTPTPAPTPIPTIVDVTFQKGDGKGNVSETDDANLEADREDRNSGRDRELNVDGRPHTHFVLKFPNIFGNGDNQIPLGSTINSATLTLKVKNSTDSDPDLYQLLEGWDESEVTWEERADDFGWSDEGADGTGSHKAEAVGQFPATRNGNQSMDVTASLQNWSNGEANVGWVLIDNSNNGADFDSSEARRDRDRPKLTVNYTTP